MLSNSIEYRVLSKYMDKIVSAFIDIVIQQKKLQFLANEVTFDQILFTEGILKLETNKISIKDFSLVAKYFVLKYKEKFNFKLSENFKDNVDFIESIKDDFTNNSFTNDYFILEKEIWKLIVKESNSEYKCSFYNYLNGTKPEGIYNFVNAYSSLLPELELTGNEVLENAIILLELTKSDAVFNTTVNNIMTGVKNWCKINYENGVNLLHNSLTLNEGEECIISAIVSGLYESKRNEFYEAILKRLIKDETKINPILLGLSDVSGLSNSDCELFIMLIKSFINRSELIISTLSLVFSILRSKETQYQDFCFDIIESMIKNEKTSYYILNHLNLIENYNEEKTSVIIKLINQEYFTIEKYITSISHCLLHQKDFISFKNIVLSIIENCSFEKFIKQFHTYFISVDPIELDNFIIELLIGDSAKKRFTGTELFDELSTPNPYCFSFNILELTSISQYKLWVALTQCYYDPKKRLPALLPLLDSKSEFIKESFIWKLEEVSEDYGGHITAILEDNLNRSIPYYSAVIKRVEKHIEEFYSKNVNCKESILELNPHYTHYKSIKNYEVLVSKKMNKLFKKGAKENSLLSTLGANTIQLSKGGGWRVGAKREISQLGRMGASFIMPRSYFINPTSFELSKGMEMVEDWTDDDFIGIKSILQNE